LGKNKKKKKRSGGKLCFLYFQQVILQQFLCNR
jgi:hypothetical protein